MEKTKKYKKLSSHILIIVAIIFLAAISLQSTFALDVSVTNNTLGGGSN